MRINNRDDFMGDVVRDNFISMLTYSYIISI